MANSSATGGYLQPAGTPAPAEDDALDDIIQAAVVGITGLSGDLVRPRFQPGHPRHPEHGTNWCAVGVVESTRDAGPAIEHQAAGDGFDRYTRHQEIRVLASFYGPNAHRFAGLLADGLAVPQNLETLAAQGVAFIDADDARRVPELINQQWVNRYDVPVRLRRAIRRSYPILNILSADPAYSTN
ncbi:MAG: hypothetical protein IV112_08410 [Methyloversatilis discipulorum]|uniref:phage neck terminator protein n=1 Tax=Methyloversatilis discipulorum TaxID=1119528 RepID=UPI0026EE8EA7|nr:hypothetical protein [Methyloversatilis discipulorum]MBT9516702.1 hypothetical protein [Methyloversatilis discipulorum]